MRLSRNAHWVLIALLLVLLVSAYGQKPAPYVPLPEPPLPDPWDIPFPNDPPSPFTDPFDPISDLPDPWDIPFPPEDPLDPPFDDFPLPPDPWDEPDPLPDVPSLFPDPFDEIPLPPPPPPGAAMGSAPRAVAANVHTVLMPFPLSIPFHPAYLPKPAAPSKPACDPAGAYLLVPESKRNTLWFGNLCPAGLITRIAVGIFPVGVVGSPDHSTALVANAGDGKTSGSVSVISVSNHALARTIAMPSATPDGSVVVPNSIAFLPDGSRAYVGLHNCSPGSFIYIIDMTSFNIVGNLRVGCFVSGLAVSPDGSQLWVSTRGDSRVEVFDTATNASITAYNVQLATGIDFQPNGTLAYIGEGSGAGNLVVVDTSTFQIVTRIPVGNLPYSVKVTPSGHHVFVTNGVSNTISMINTSTNTVTRTIKMPNNRQHPTGLTFMP